MAGNTKSLKLCQLDKKKHRDTCSDYHYSILHSAWVHRNHYNLDLPKNVSSLKHKLDKNVHGDLEVKKAKPPWFSGSSYYASSAKKKEEASAAEWQKFTFPSEKVENRDIPVAVDPPDNCEFAIGSMVEVRYKKRKEPQPGVIKWIGTTRDGKFYAGLEMVCSFNFLMTLFNL